MVRATRPSYSWCQACGGACPDGYSLATMHDASTPPPDLVLPAFDVQALARRAALPAAFAGAGAAAVVLAGGPLQAFADAFGRALAADPRWVTAAAAFEILSFSGYVALLWLVGSRATPRLGPRESAQVTLGGAAVTRLLPTGGAGGVAMTIWAFRRAGLSATDANRTLLTFLVILYSVFLGAIALAGGALALGLASGGAPSALSALPAAGAALAIAAGLALAARSPGAVTSTPAVGASRARRLRAAVGNAPASLGAAVRDALAIIRRGDLRLLGAFVWWGLDAAVLWAMLHALGEPPALAIIVLGYFVGQVANMIPLPGAVSGGMVGVLLGFGVETDLAIAAVLAYRSVAIWLPAPFGLVALRSLRRTVARWDSEGPLVRPVPAPSEPPRALPAIARSAPSLRAVA